MLPLEMSTMGKRCTTSSTLLPSSIHARRCSRFASSIPVPGGTRKIGLYNVSRSVGGRVFSQLQFTQTEDSSASSLDYASLNPAISSNKGPTTLPQLWPELAERYGDSLALLDPHSSPQTSYTFAELSTTISTFAAGLSSLGLSPGDKVSLFSENSARWLVADQGIQACGAIDAVRGVSSTVEELSYILLHSESSGLIVQDAATLVKLAPALAASPLRSSISFIVVMWGQVPESDATVAGLPCPVLTFDQILERGRGAATPAVSPPTDGNSLATLVYTSGTTGHPKGVMLTHSNILYQVNEFPEYLSVQPGERTLSLLPPWHIYERTVSYHVLSRGATQVYTNIRNFKEDLTKFPPDHFVCVPLVLDTLRSRVMATLKKASFIRRTLALTLFAGAITYTRLRRIIDGVALDYAIKPRPVLTLLKAWFLSILLTPVNWLAQKLVAAKVRAALGIRKTVVCGGGSLAPHLDDFFETIGLPVLNGYGLTETSPVLACRSALRPLGNVRGSVGRVIPGGTELRVVDPESMQDVPDGVQGLILAKGPGVTFGYYNNESATAAAFSSGDGWFDTGDLGWKAPKSVPGSTMEGCLVLTGRAKDTIVLSSGENVEPQPIEDALCCSPYIKFAALVGQGHRSLGALLVPDEDALKELAAARGVKELSFEEVNDLMKEAVAAAGAGRIRWEHVTAFKVLERAFSIEDGTLTRTMKPRRQVISQVYANEVAELEKKLR